MNNNKMMVYAGLVLAFLIVLVVWFSFYMPSKEAAEITNVVATTTEITTNSTSSTTDTTANTDTTENTGGTKAISGYPASWPSDVPKYPSGTVSYNGGDNPQSGPNEATVVLKTSDSVRTAVDFYLKGLVANGWKITESGNGLVNMVNFRATKSRRTVGGYAVKGIDGKTTITVGVNTGL